MTKPTRFVEPSLVTAELERRLLRRPNHLELLREVAREAARRASTD